MDIVKHMDKKFAVAHEDSIITADEWFAIREVINLLKKEIERLRWQMNEQD